MNTRDKEYMAKVDALRDARKVAARARTAFYLANSEVSRLDAECTRALNDCYIATFKEPETP